MSADRNASRMNDDDIQRIVAALNRAPPPLVAAMTGADSDVVRRFVADEVEKALRGPMQELRASADQLGRKIESFLPDAEIERRIVARFERIGLRVDDDHFEETGDAIRGFMKWHKRADKVVGGIAISVLGAVLLALLKLVGINLPAPGGN